MRYYRSGLTNLAPPHYLRNRTDTAPYLESFYYERDPPFSITCDYKMISLIIENSLKFADRIGARIRLHFLIYGNGFILYHVLSPEIAAVITKSRMEHNLQHRYFLLSLHSIRM